MSAVAGAPSPSRMTPTTRAGRARVWGAPTRPRDFPERQLDRAAPRATGVCLSGGGTRAFAAALGQLRGLVSLGLLDRVGYLSAVSGGGWAAVPFTYSAGPAATDAGMLGEPEPPATLSFDRLDELRPDYLGAAATLDFRRMLEELVGDPAVPRDQVWVRAVGQTFLAPFGLFDSEAPRSFTWTEETRDDVVQRNPRLADPPLHVVVDRSRPFLLVHTVLNWPGSPGGPMEIAPFECSPLGVGASRALTLTRGGETRQIGGGYLEPWAFGCGAPETGPDGDGIVTVPAPARPFTLADVLGATSAFNSQDRDLRMYPHAEHWPIQDDGAAAGHRYIFTDGGDLENYGLLALLRRRVDRIVVFINTLHPLSPDHDPSRWLERGGDAVGSLDPFLAPLFGQPSPRMARNQVFNAADFHRVVRELQAAKRAGGSVIARARHAVQANDWWGIEGGWEAEVCWVYNDRVPAWESQLTPALQDAIDGGRSPDLTGPFARFPHYLTRGHNPGSLIRLTAPQVNLLAALSCWNVVEHAALFHELLG